MDRGYSELAVKEAFLDGAKDLLSLILSTCIRYKQIRLEPDRFPNGKPSGRILTKSYAELARCNQIVTAEVQPPRQVFRLRADILWGSRHANDTISRDSSVLGRRIYDFVFRNVTKELVVDSQSCGTDCVMETVTFELCGNRMRQLASWSPKTVFLYERNTQFQIHLHLCQRLRRRY